MSLGNFDAELDACATDAPRDWLAIVRSDPMPTTFPRVGEVWTGKRGCVRTITGFQIRGGVRVVRYHTDRACIEPWAKWQRWTTSATKNSDGDGRIPPWGTR